MRPDISEFSYGFAVVDELINWRGLGLTAAPVFPSLYEEGQTEIGYDVRLDRPGVPLFLQFKLAHRMVRRNAWEFREKLLDVPFFRMKLRPSRFSSQHSSLLQLDDSGATVYYVAPVFSTLAEFNDAYFDREIVTRSVFIRPSQIGKLPDDDPHHVSYRDASLGYLLSEPHKLEGRFSFEGVNEAITAQISEREQPLEPILRRLADTMYAIALENKAGRRGWKEVNLGPILAVPSVVKRVAYLSRHFFECEMLIVQRRKAIEKR